jgi:hypothetical protein
MDPNGEGVAENVTFEEVSFCKFNGDSQTSFGFRSNAFSQYGGNIVVEKIIATMVLLAGLSYQNAEAGKKEKFSLELSSSMKSVHVDQRIDMTITVRNMSDGPLTLRFSPSGKEPEFLTDVIVRSTNGGEVSETQHERQVKGHGMIALDYNSKFVTLQPEESFQETLQLSKLFNLTQPGAYVVQAERHGEDLNSQSMMIKSNRVSFVILP